MLYIFGDYELDTQVYELRHAGKPVKTPPQVFNVLSYLVEHHDRTVTKQELLDNLWPGQFTSEAVLSYSVMTARKAVGDNGQTQRVIKTVHGRGFRFIAALKELGHEAPESTPFAVTPAANSHTPDDKRQLATVLCVTLANAVSLSEQREFNALQRIRQAFFALAQQEVQGQAGTLQFYGADGILGLFGMPVACEDHRQRSVRVALRLQQRLRQRLLELDDRQAFQLSVRMGLHTGPVAVDSIPQDQRIAATEMGETMNLAVWLQYLAQPGALLISQSTMRLGGIHQLLQDMAVHGQPVQVQVPGYADPVAAFTINEIV
ncbi:MAG: winged helix-turn-helix domain-containing protein [bacterium]|nr:winged helix-turn-helix domain-containing protein [bacterium]